MTKKNRCFFVYYNYSGNHIVAPQPSLQGLLLRYSISLGCFILLRCSLFWGLGVFI